MNFLRLALRTLLRDLRAGELHLLGIALVIAVASLVSVGFLTDRVAQALEREANQLLGGDLLLKSDHPWDPAIPRAAAQDGLRVVTTTLFSSMAMGPEGVQLAGVKAVEPGYPLRGSLRIAPGPNQPDAPAPGVPPRGEAWLDERLFAALGLKPGGLVGLGNLQLRATAQVAFESDRGANFFSVLPRILINAADLPATGLIQEGSRVTWQLQVAGDPEPVAAFRNRVKGRLERGQALESVENARPEVRSALDQAQRFLRLAALTAVVLAAVAVGLAARRFLRRHLDGCAVMRCLGARAPVPRLGNVARLVVVAPVHLAVHARRLDAPARQHAVPGDLRPAGGTRARFAQISRAVPDRRRLCQPDRRLDAVGPVAAHHRLQRCGVGDARCLSRAVSACAPGTGAAARFVPAVHPRAGGIVDRYVGAAATAVHVGRSRFRDGGVVGAPGRFRFRHPVRDRFAWRGGAAPAPAKLLIHATARRRASAACAKPSSKARAASVSRTSARNASGSSPSLRKASARASM